MQGTVNLDLAFFYWLCIFLRTSPIVCRFVGRILPSEVRQEGSNSIWVEDSIGFSSHMLCNEFRKCRQISEFYSISFNGFGNYIRLSIGDR